ncbi:MAG: dihydrolipoyl dehydrogenase [Solirubrobacteraceae bacterium]
MTEVAEVRVPDIGDFTDVPVIEIHVSAGDEVQPEDPLVTLESDKATMDVPAPFAGTVTQISVAIGDRVSEGSVLLMLESGDGSDGASDGSAPDAADTEGPATDRDAEPAAASESAAATTTTTADAPDSGASNGRPGSGETPSPPPPPGESEYDAQVLVLGAGPGGYTAAFRAADLGLKTILVERYERLGGVCLNVGCIPSKALLHAARVISEAQEMGAHGIHFEQPHVDLDALRSWKQSVVDKLTGGLEGLARQRKVEVVHGSARFTGPHSLEVGDRTITFDSCIIACGSQAASLPHLPDDRRIVTSTGALELHGVPGRLLVIGGGIIGLEMATVYDALGSNVTVVEMLDQLLPGCDPDLVRPLQKRISERYDAILLETKVETIEGHDDGLHVKLSNGEWQTFDAALVAIGRIPNGGSIGASDAGVEVDEKGFISVDKQMRTNVGYIYAIGDVVGGPMLAHKASHEGKVAAEVIAGVPGAEFDARAIPSVAYTDPEVAWMGLTETAAKAEGVEYEKGVIPWSVSGRALGLGRPDGMTKVLFEPGTRRVLGAGIVGVNAGELVAETVHAIEMGSDAEDIGLTIHPHPTLSETVMFAAEMVAGTITDLPQPKKRAQR